MVVTVVMRMAVMIAVDMAVLMRVLLVVMRVRHFSESTVRAGQSPDSPT